MKKYLNFLVLIWNVDSDYPGIAAVQRGSFGHAGSRHSVSRFEALGDEIEPLGFTTYAGYVKQNTLLIS